MSTSALIVFVVAALLVGSVILMWRNGLRGLLVSIITLSLLICPFIVIYTTERLPKWKLIGLKLIGALFTVSLVCLLLYGIVLAVRCWRDDKNNQGTGG